MQFSSITRKTCKCSLGCTYMPTISYEGYYMPHTPQEVLDRLEAKQKRKNALKRDSGKVRSIAIEVKPPKGYKTKSELLKEADRLFADYIKRRDTDKNGNVFCPCCNETFNATDEQFGLPVINCMHFVDRDVYSLRFDEDAAHAGHAWCNKSQHYEPKGKEYQNFKSFLIDKFGEVAVAEMEVQHRKINKIDEQTLKTVIEHYSQ